MGNELLLLPNTANGNHVPRRKVHRLALARIRATIVTIGKLGTLPDAAVAKETGISPKPRRSGRV